jgi:hypothetical protein
MRTDKQAHPRKKGRLMVRYGLDEPDRTAFTMNLSLGGAYIRTNSVVKPGTQIQVEIDLPAGKHTMWARVVWAKRVPPELAHILPCGMGVRFVNPGSAWAEAFASWKKG